MREESGTNGGQIVYADKEEKAALDIQRHYRGLQVRRQVREQHNFVPSCA